MAKDFKQNPFMKSIQSEYFYREQEIKIEKEHKQKAQEYLEDSQRRKELLSKRIEADEKRRYNENQLRYKKKQKNITLKKPKNRHKSLMNHKKPVDQTTTSKCSLKSLYFAFLAHISIFI